MNLCCCFIVLAVNKRHRALCTLIKSFHVTPGPIENVSWRSAEFTTQKWGKLPAMQQQHKKLSILKFPSFLGWFRLGVGIKLTRTWCCTEEDYWMCIGTDASEHCIECHNWKISLITRHLPRNLSRFLDNNAIKSEIFRETARKGSSMFTVSVALRIH